MNLLLTLLVGAANAQDASAVTCATVVSTTTDGPRIDAVDLSNGARTTSVSSTPLTFSSVHGLARDGDGFVLCADGVLQSVAGDGTVAATALPCDLVATGTAGVLVVHRASALAGWYTSLEAVTGGDVATATPYVGLAHVVALDGDEVLSVAHGKGVVRRWALTSDEPVSALTLDGIHPPVQGISVVGGVLYVLDDNRTEAGEATRPAIHRFDLSSGALVATTLLTLGPGELARGLTCESLP